MISEIVEDKALLLLKLVFIVLDFLQAETRSLIPRITLSTIVMSAVWAVLDSGLRSNVMTVFPIFCSASVLSPSSSGTRTTSAAKIPSLSTIRLGLSSPPILRYDLGFVPKTCFAPAFFSDFTIFFFLFSS
uniref:Uncharacterized protein n=1 Tax=uncultured marine crenarchaeote HF4000_APKG8G15 TaxID=455605 RepID=B3TAW6_9ARCH|nr:hypothetical protein ALOHA_HF4000APKG8G15ctg1g64 [uncultured marine crenarchaeote HF4000_APKG8G15]